jgi:predicted O-linked N-acetylglucosamine transferase (SPINDLY family)
MKRPETSQPDRNRREAVIQNDLGKDLIRQGRRGEAAASFERAVKLDANFAEAHNNFGNTLNDHQRFDEAIGEYRRAIALNPQYVEAHFNLGNAFRGKGVWEEAIASYRQALKIRPGLAEAHNGIGNVLVDMNRCDEAIEAFNNAIAIQPRHAMAYNNLATALRKTGKLEPALHALNQAVELQPDYAVAYSNRGMILSDLRRYDVALDSLKKAVSLRPDFVEGFTNLIRVLRELGRAHEAAAICNQIIRVMPNYAEAYCELAGLLQELGQVGEARAMCARALSLRGDFPEALNNMGNILRDQGNLEGAIQSYRKALELKPEAIGIRGNLAFTLQFASGYDSAAILAENRRWAELHEKPLATEIRPHSNDRTPDRILKIGYVSSYFRLHCAAFFLMPVLAHHDANRVQVFCYSGVKQPDAITNRFKDLNLIWRDTAGLTDAELAEQIRKDQIDILIDITLHMQNSRLLTFARKPAPVQVTWLGYPGTTGLASMDYRFTDPYLDPAEENDQFYSERSIRLPHTFWCYSALEETPEVSPLPAGSKGHITFGCFNNFHKVTPETIALWGKVLTAVAGSRMMILSQPGSHRDVVLRTFEQSGVSPDRISFVARLPLSDYFRLYQQVDLCLDTIPYPGHTTTLDSLWMGVPVITLAGQTTVGRGGVSILSNVDLRKFIAGTSEEYVNIAKAITGDLDGLSELRQGLRERLRCSALMNAKQFATDMENAFRRMWIAYCEGRDDSSLI